MLYIARKTYIARASVYGIIFILYVVLKGLHEERLGYYDGTGTWYWFTFNAIEILLLLTSYCMIFFERVTNKNKAKFQKFEKLVRYLKEVDEN